MELLSMLDWSWLSWFLPLVAGAGLTFFVGWLGELFTDGRRAAEIRITDARDEKIRRRTNAREDALSALRLAIEIRDDVDLRALDSQHGDAGGWNKEQLRRLRDVGILIPDPSVRRP